MTRDDLQSLIGFIDKIVTKDDEDMRFTIVVWRSGHDHPQFSGGNTACADCVQHMLRTAADIVETKLAEAPVVGHA